MVTHQMKNKKRIKKKMKLNSELVKQTAVILLGVIVIGFFIFSFYSKLDSMNRILEKDIEINQTKVLVEAEKLKSNQSTLSNEQLAKLLTVSSSRELESKVIGELIKYMNVTLALLVICFICILVAERKIRSLKKHLGH